MSDEHGHDDPSHSLPHYNKIAVILIILAIVSWLGPEMGIPIVTLIAAFGIAFVKAYLVIKHFMHLTVEKTFVLYMLGTALVLMGVFYAGTAPDVMGHRGRNWENVAAQSEVRKRVEAGGMPLEHHGEEGHGAEGHGDHDHGGHDHGAEGHGAEGHDDHGHSH